MTVNTILIPETNNYTTDLGSHKSGTSVPFKINLVNEGTEDFNLTRLAGGCSCTNVTSNLTRVPPKGILTITGSVIKNYAGKHDLSITVSGNLAKNINLFLKLTTI